MNEGKASEVAGLEPAEVWSLFSRITAIPHPSKKEEQLCRFVRTTAGEHGLKVREDRAGNMVIPVPASPGREQAPVTVLQGHLDMVCEKNADCAHDFERDPLRLRLDQDGDGKAIVRADGTTLGADNGIGLAMALAAATAPEVVHGPLELLFTVDEEAGMTGADALTPELFSGRILLNLDSEEDDALYVGCAGGCDTTLSWELGLSPVDREAAAVRVTVSGLRGGHSGGDIHENRGNAIKLLARTISRVLPAPVRITSIRGGQLRNAIPREAEAAVSGSRATLDALQTAAAEVASEAIGESGEKTLLIRVEPIPADQVSLALSAADSRRVLLAIAALPHGVLGMHRTIEGLVETSNNVATVRSGPAQDGKVLVVEIGTLARSSSTSLKWTTAGQITAVGALAGATVVTGNEYPGWEPNPNSPTLAVCRRVYQQLFGEEPKVTAIHAGLECGIIGERVGGMDMTSFGPRIEGAHSPEERVYVASVQKSWKYLQAVLAELAHD